MLAFLLLRLSVDDELIISSTEREVTLALNRLSDERLLALILLTLNNPLSRRQAELLIEKQFQRGVTDEDIAKADFCTGIRDAYAFNGTGI